MDPQTLFYTLASIFMILLIVALVMFIFLILYIKSFVDHLYGISREIKEKINRNNPMGSFASIAKQGLAYFWNRRSKQKEEEL